MATLEIHDSRKQVRRVQISRENPVMFGSDPMCDVILDGPGIHPFHGRIRWKTRRFKADASPDVESIEVNGQAVKSKSLYQGDEIRVGQCRIFLMSVEDGPDHGEKTVMQDRATSAIPAQARPVVPGADFHRMEMAPPSMESSTAPFEGHQRPEPLKRSKFGRSRALESDEDDPDALRQEMKKLKRRAPKVDPATGTATAARKKGPLANLLNFDRAPGDDRVLNSPIVLGMAGTFVILVVTSFVLWGVIARANARRVFDVASSEFEGGDFRNAIKGFDQFLTTNPTDPRSNKARVLRSFARVRQHTGNVGASWGNALKEAREMVQDVGSLDEYRDVSVDLAAELRKIAEGLADNAREQANSATLAEAEAAVAFHARVAGPAASSLMERSRALEKIDKARLAIRKFKDRADALAAMDVALKARSASDAYTARDVLARRYPDLAGDKELVSRLVQANDLIRQGVTFDSSSHPAETEPHVEILGPPLSLVLRLEPGKLASPGSSNSIAFAMADGMALGLDATTGAPRWQIPVGLSSPFPPIAVPGDPPTALVLDARHDELTRVDARTGALIWRLNLGGPVEDPPLILGNQILQATPDGRLLQVDMASGGLRGTLKLGRKLAHTPVPDDSAQHLYLLADEDCLFILSPDPLGCEAVEYLGHESGSVACPPARVGRFLVLPENHGIDTGRWRVFVIDEGGIKIRQVQELPVVGWTRSTPSSSGQAIWSSSDRGEMIAYSIGQLDAKAPFTTVARIAPSTQSEGPAFPKARTERDFWISSSRSGRYELNLERQKITTNWTLTEAGPSLAPIQLFDRVAVLTQQYLEGPGTALWGVDLTSGQVRWRTVLGSTWPIPLSSSDSGDALSTFSSDGRSVALGLDQLKAGGFVEQPLPKAGSFRLPPTTTQRLEVDGSTVIVPSSNADRVLVKVGGSEFKAVDLPAPLGAPALVLGKNLLIPGLDGRVYLIDPRTGVSAADPYVPTFDRAKQTRWQSVVAVDGDAVVLADSDQTLRRMTVVANPRPRLVVGAELKLDKPMAADPASTGSAVIVATEDGRVRSLASRDLGPQGNWPMEGPRVLGPLIVAGHAFVGDALGNVLALAPDGHRLWSLKLRVTLPAGAPVLLDQSVWFLGRDGSVQRFGLADGSPQGWTKLEILPAGNLLAAGPDLVVPTGPGTVRVLSTKAAEAAPGGRK